MKLIILAFISSVFCHERPGLCIPSADLACSISHYCKQRPEGWYAIKSGKSCCPVAKMHCPSGTVMNCPGGFVEGKCYRSWSRRRSMPTSSDSMEFDGNGSLEMPLCEPLDCRPVPTVTVSICSSTSMSPSASVISRSYRFTPTCQATSSSFVPTISSSFIPTTSSSYFVPTASSTAEVTISYTTATQYYVPTQKY